MWQCGVNYGTMEVPKLPGWCVDTWSLDLSNIPFWFHRTAVHSSAPHPTTPHLIVKESLDFLTHGAPHRTAPYRHISQTNVTAQSVQVSRLQSLGRPDDFVQQFTPVVANGVVFEVSKKKAKYSVPRLFCAFSRHGSG